jgi:hypothetical protein
MKTIRIIVLFLTASFGWLAKSALADGTNTSVKPPVVSVAPNATTLPPQIQSLLGDYQAAREKYLAQQQVLLQKLKGATEAQRNQIRAQLQADRQAFLAQVAAFRQQLRQEITALEVKIHNQELNRLINSGQGGGGHKGH